MKVERTNSKEPQFNPNIQLKQVKDRENQLTSDRPGSQGYLSTLDNQENFSKNNLANHGNNKQPISHRQSSQNGTRGFQAVQVQKSDSKEIVVNTLQTQESLKVSSQSGFSMPNSSRQDKMNPASNVVVEVVNKASVYQCGHSRPQFKQDYKLNSHQGNALALVGDAHLVNCNQCGAYFPKSGSLAVRALKRHTYLYKLYSSDILRATYSQCQTRSTQKPEHQVKISAQYQEVRSLIIDWLAEVAETLHLGIQLSAYHAVVLLDKFLSSNIKNHSKEMDQGTIMLQALCCLFISAKNYEKDPNVPSSRKFLRQLPGYKPTQAERQQDNMAYQYGLNSLQGGAQGADNMRYNSKKNELVAQETQILNEIGFDMDSHPTFFIIVEILMAQGIMYTSDKHFQSTMQDEKCVNLLEKYVDFFVLLALQDHKLVNTNQYLISCSIVSAARKQCNINPVWSQELEQLTGLQHSHFCNIEKRLMTKFEQQYNQKNKLKNPTKPIQQAVINLPISKKMISQERPQDHTSASSQPTVHLSNIKTESAQQKLQLKVPGQDAQDEQPSQSIQQQQSNHQREVSKSNLLGRHQDSSLFRNMVTENKNKYDQKIQAEKASGDESETYESRQAQMRAKYGSNKQKASYYTSRMQQNGEAGAALGGPGLNASDQPQTLRKFGNAKGSEIERNHSQSALSTNSQTSNSAIIRLKHQELYNQNGQQKQGTMTRQKSQVVGQANGPNTNVAASVDYADSQRQNERNQMQKTSQNIITMGNHQNLQIQSLGPQSSSTKAGDRPATQGLQIGSQPKFDNITASMPKNSQKSQQLYSRELSNVKFQIAANGRNIQNKTGRGNSQNSNSSYGGLSSQQTQQTTNRFIGGKQSTQSDNKSLVRQALKNQKRNQKITIAESSIIRAVGNTTAGSHGGGSNNGSGSNQGSVSAVQRIQRLRISSNNKLRPYADAEPTQPMMAQQQQPRVGSNLPRVSNQKFVQVNQRSLSSSGQKVTLGGHAGSIQVPNSQLIKNKMKVAGVMRDNSMGSAYSNENAAKNQMNRSGGDFGQRPGSSHANQMQQQKYNAMLQQQRAQDVQMQMLGVPNGVNQPHIRNNSQGPTYQSQEVNNKGMRPQINVQQK